jgi:hypothetical protein
MAQLASKLAGLEIQSPVDDAIGCRQSSTTRGQRLDYLTKFTFTFDAPTRPDIHVGDDWLRD